MIPLRDVDSRARGVPAATLGLIAANAMVYLLMSTGGGSRFEDLIWRYATIPGNVTGRTPTRWQVLVVGGQGEQAPRLRLERFPTDDDRSWEAKQQQALYKLRSEGVWPVYEIESFQQGQAVPAWLTLISSMFMHGGLMHILGNMLFLWVFGQRLEYRMGRLRYLTFYLVAGVVAGLTHVLLNMSSSVPTVGASGAISGLLGGYMLLYPRGRILTLLPIFFFFYLIELPAFLFLGIWFVYQVLLVGQEHSVAVWAHLGGFVFGLLVIRLVVPGREPPARGVVRPWRGRPDIFDHFRE